MIKEKLKNSLLYFINKPANNILSSQTLYELLMTTIKMYKITNERKWLDEAKVLSQLILSTQNDDGGFNIGYDFIFGKNMSKSQVRESTTPEVLSIFALKEYFELTKDESVLIGIDKGLKWILKNVIKGQQGEYMIPYAPSTSKEVHITNATSFASGTLALFSDNVEIKKIVIGMNKYMKNQLECADNGSYWRYFDRFSSNYANNPGKEKIDNYHIAQQLRYHSFSHTLTNDSYSLEITKRVRDYLLSEISNEGWISYIKKDFFDQNRINREKIDLWGYASVLKGIVSSTIILETKKDEVYFKINKIFDNIYNFAWNGKYFNPIIFNDGKIYDSRFYPRSDAWVIHSLIFSYEYLSEENKLKMLNIVDENFSYIKSHNYKGLENHAISNRKIMFSKIINYIRR